MSCKLLLIFSHKLTPKQKKEAKLYLNVKKIVKLPKESQKFWSKVEAQGNIDKSKLQKIADWIIKNSEKKDYVLVQGDFGATFYIVDFCLKNGRIPIYSTTERKVKEEKIKDKIIKSSVFEHINFRKYERSE